MVVNDDDDTLSHDDDPLQLADLECEYQRLLKVGDSLGINDSFVKISSETRNQGSQRIAELRESLQNRKKQESKINHSKVFDDEIETATKQDLLVSQLEELRDRVAYERSQNLRSSHYDRRRLLESVHSFGDSSRAQNHQYENHPETRRDSQSMHRELIEELYQSQHQHEHELIRTRLEHATKLHYQKLGSKDIAKLSKHLEKRRKREINILREELELENKLKLDKIVHEFETRLRQEKAKIIMEAESLSPETSRELHEMLERKRKKILSDLRKQLAIEHHTRMEQLTEEALRDKEAEIEQWKEQIRLQYEEEERKLIEDLEASLIEGASESKEAFVNELKREQQERCATAREVYKENRFDILNSIEQRMKKATEDTIQKLEVEFEQEIDDAVSELRGRLQEEHRNQVAQAKERHDIAKAELLQELEMSFQERNRSAEDDLLALLAKDIREHAEMLQEHYDVQLANLLESTELQYVSQQTKFISDKQDRFMKIVNTLTKKQVEAYPGDFGTTGDAKLLPPETKANIQLLGQLVNEFHEVLGELEQSKERFAALCKYTVQGATQKSNEADSDGISSD